MGNAKMNAGVVKVPDVIPQFIPPPVPPHANEAHPALVWFGNFMLLVGDRASTTLEHLLSSETPITAADPDDASTRPNRGVRRALVVGSPPPVTNPPPRTMPGRCQLRLAFLISACCSPAAIIKLSSLIGSTIVSSDVPVDPSHVLEIVNESTGHVSGNVAAASSCCLLEAGLKLVELVCKATCDSSSSTGKYAFKLTSNPQNAPARVATLMYDVIS
ncbi:hypothetical protein FRC11_014115 [Ceratobasidium sp. 423]|nr:hypothetical protein FRC11_014115 [Ceratobasidium sp. 423]